MRRIKTPEEIESSAKRKKIIVGLIMVFIMVTSSVGFAFYSSDNSGQVENQENTINPYGFIEIYLGNNKVYLTNYPESILDVPVDIEKKALDYSGAEIYIDSNNTFAELELTLNLQNYASKISRACYGNCEQDVPEKDCSSNLIVFKQSDEAKVYSLDNCVFIEGGMKSVDAFIYNIFN